MWLERGNEKLRDLRVKQALAVVMVSLTPNELPEFSVSRKGSRSAGGAGCGLELPHNWISPENPDDTL